MTGIIHDLQRRIERIEEDIESKSRAIRRTLDRVDHHIIEGLRLNELGEIQRDGVDLDRLIALRQQAYDTLGMLQHEETA